MEAVDAFVVVAVHDGRIHWAIRDYATRQLWRCGSVPNYVEAVTAIGGKTTIAPLIIRKTIACARLLESPIFFPHQVLQRLPRDVVIGPTCRLNKQDCFRHAV